MQAAEYYNSRPRKATGAGVLFFNAKDELLIVKPNYLNRWLWVGGGIEENETPLEAAIRESQEEIGVTPDGLRLALYNTDRQSLTVKMSLFILFLLPKRLTVAFWKKLNWLTEKLKTLSLSQ